MSPTQLLILKIELIQMTIHKSRLIFTHLLLQFQVEVLLDINFQVFLMFRHLMIYLLPQAFRLHSTPVGQVFNSSTGEITGDPEQGLFSNVQVTKFYSGGSEVKSFDIFIHGDPLFIYSWHIKIQGKVHSQQVVALAVKILIRCRLLLMVFLAMELKF